MTLKELYDLIGGDYDRAIGTLRIEKLMDKHIRKFPAGGVAEAVIAAGETMDPTQLFESAHAMKGVCGNLGLTALASLASDIAEEYRPGKTRTMTDGEVKEKIGEIGALYKKTAEGIRLYESALG
ncbi:MAG: Hpt domain-containing protein [Clostridia bacterium]|nr:Hpt domain-containing protein [Clostridia bacterium]